MRLPPALPRYLLSIITLLVVTPSFSATYVVTPAGTGDYATIQDAIDASANGDTILLGPGTFTGTGNKNLDTNGLALYISSLSGAQNTIIDCESNGRAFYVHSGETAGTVIHDITVTNGEAAALDERGGAVRCDNASPTVLECVFLYNYGEFGGAIFLNESGARIIRSRFVENNCHTVCDGPGGPFSWVDNGAIYCEDSDPVIVGNYFTMNKAGNGGKGAAVGGVRSTFYLVGNEFDRNGQVQSSGSVYVDSSTVHIFGNSFHDNTGEGYACVRADNSSGVVRANYFHDNDPYCVAGGVYASNSDLSIDYNLIADNGGLGIYVSDAAPVLHRNIITRGSFICFEYGRGIALYNSPGAVITNNVLYENAPTAVSPGGTEISYSGGAPTIESNILYNTNPVAMVACEATPSSPQRAAAAVDTTHLTDNYFWGDPMAYIYSYTYGCIGQGVYGDPLFCGPAADNWFLQPGSYCIYDTLIVGGGAGGNDLYLFRFNGALPVGCGTSDVLTTTVPPDNSVSPASPGDVYVLSGFTVTNDSDLEAPVYYELRFEGDAVPFDQGDPLAFVGVTPILQPGELFTPPEAALIVPDAPGISTATVTYLVAYAPALNMPDTLVTTINFGVPTPAPPPPAPKLALHQNVPNPFARSTSISFSLNERMHLALSIYNVEGKLVKTLIDDVESAGPHTIWWDGKNDRGTTQSTGVYFCRLKTSVRTITRKMILLK